MEEMFHEEIFTKDEIKDIIISVVILSLCLTIATGHLFEVVKLPMYIAFFGITVGSGFVLHELGHKFVAIYLGAYARFKKWMGGLIIALATSFIGVVFLAPGAVYIYAPHLSKFEYAIVSLAGPVMNLLLVLLFSIMAITMPVYMGNLEMWSFAAFINAWLGLFNLIPIPPLDGSKIINWNFLVWLLVGAIFLIVFLMVGARI